MALEDIGVRAVVQNLQGYLSGIDKMNDAVDGHAKQTEKASNKAGAAIKGIGIALAGVGVAAVGVGALALKMASDFDTGMREVNTLIGLSEDEFQDLSQQTSDLAARLGVDAVASTKALYQAISAGVPRENVLSFMEVAAKAAIGGVTDTMTAVDGLTTVINAFQLPMEDASRVADVMFAGVKAGKTTFEELSASMFNVAPIAQAASVSFEETTAAIAALTTAGVPTSVATTQIRAAIQGLLKPSEDMTKLFKKAGFESGQMALEQIGLVEAMKLVQEATDGDIGALTKLVGSIEGVGAVLSLTGAQNDIFNATLADMTENSGQANAAYAEMNKSLDRQIAMLKGQFEGALRNVGMVLLPIAIDAVKAFADGWDRLQPVVQGVGKVLDELRPTLDNIGQAMGDIKTFFEENKLALDALTALLAGAAIAAVIAFTSAIIALGVAAAGAAIAVAAVALPFIALAAVIGAVILAGKQVVENWDLITFVAQTMVALVGHAFDQLGTKVSETLSSFLDIGRSIVDGLLSGIRERWDGLLNTVKELIRQLPEGIRNFLGIASPSTVFAEIGEDLMLGLAEGIEDASAAPMEAMQEAVEQTLQARDAFAAWREELKGLLAEGKLGAVAQGFRDMGATAEQAVEATIRLFDEMVRETTRATEEAAAETERMWNDIEARQEQAVASTQRLHEQAAAEVSRTWLETFRAITEMENAAILERAANAQAIFDPLGLGRGMSLAELGAIQDVGRRHGERRAIAEALEELGREASFQEAVGGNLAIARAVREAMAQIEASPALVAQLNLGGDSTSWISIIEALGIRLAALPISASMAAAGSTTNFNLTANYTSPEEPQSLRADMEALIMLAGT